LGCDADHEIRESAAADAWDVTPITKFANRQQPTPDVSAYRFAGRTKGA